MKNFEKVKDNLPTWSNGEFDIIFYNSQYKLTDYESFNIKFDTLDEAITYANEL